MTDKLNWARIDCLLQAGCPTSEVAAAMNCSPQVLKDLAMVDKACSWEEYKEAGHEKGLALLREAQFQRAAQGSDVMQKWLGEQRLGQLKDGAVASSGIAVTIKQFSVAEDGSQRLVEAG